jgi:ABC-2 type transport system permease protein
MKRIDFYRLFAIARKEAVQLRRDTRSLILAFVLPLFMVLFFGYAITWDVKDIRMAVRDQDWTPASRQLTEAFEASGYFTVDQRTDSYSEAAEAVNQGRVMAALVIPPGFERDLAAGRPSPVQFLLDGSDANTATIAMNYADAIVTRYSVHATLQGRALPQVASAETRIWYNETLASRNMVVPGLIAVIMSIIAAMLTSLTIAREWERGTMEQLASTPVQAVEIVLGKLLPYLLIGFFDVAMVLTTGLLVFGVPFRGDPILLAGMSILFLLGALGLGIFISSVADSQIFAMQAAMVATYLPALLLSGFLFDIAGMPWILRVVTYLIPARYFVTVTRGVLLKGVGVEVLWPQAVFMLAFAVLGLTLATRVFKKEIRV